MELPKPRALVIDDEEPIRQMIARVLTRDGFVVEAASDGHEAIKMIERSGYDFVVLDLMMPRVDGFGVLRHLAEFHPELLPNVIVATAMYSHSVYFPQIAGILHKPFDLGDLRGYARQFHPGGSQNLPA
ncbi:MAG: response regulator [Acidobacteria bacterium]|nr:response regulator [Acidobacteriota bacterium]